MVDQLIQGGSHSHQAYCLSENEGKGSYNGVYAHVSADMMGYSSGVDGVGIFDMSSEGDHSHSVSIDSQGGGQSFDNRPSYYALAYIMKT